MLEIIHPTKGSSKRDRFQQVGQKKRNAQRRIPIRQNARRVAEATFKEIIAKYSHNDDHETRYNELPKFSMDEVKPGIKLGQGSFGVVHEIQRLRLQQVQKEEKEERNQDTRVFMALHCRRQAIGDTIGGEARYAIKRLRPKIVHGDTVTFTKALIDTAIETRILASLPHHPNIIQLRGVASDANPFHEDYFLVLDRLYGTLKDRWNTWVEHDPLKSKAHKRNFRPVLESRRGYHWTERLNACRDLANALAHLHLHGVIHRDIKPQNIGFNIRGYLTLFDFGLSRVMPPTRDVDELFRMTGFCGSPRYMAPEVGLEQPYNTKCDVYSFGVLVWEILTLQKPYELCPLSDLKTRVWPGTKGIIGPGDWNGPCKHQRYSRPLRFGSPRSIKPQKIPHKILATTIDTSFHRNARLRPTMPNLKIVFSDMCVDEKHGTSKDDNCDSSSPTRG